MPSSKELENQYSVKRHKGAIEGYKASIEFNKKMMEKLTGTPVDIEEAKRREENIRQAEKGIKEQQHILNKFYPDY